MSSSRREASPLVPLGCPRCGANLDPLRDDILFLCPACGAVSELVGTKTVARGLRHASPDTGTRLVHLPFWRLGASSFAPAFNGSRLLTVCRWYSDKVGALDERAGGPAPRGLWGGRIGSDDAGRVHALSGERLVAPRRERSLMDSRRIEDYHATAGAVRMTPVALDPADPPEEPVLFALPFVREPSRLACVLTGLHVYLETLEGSAELLARWDALDAESGQLTSPR